MNLKPVLRQLALLSQQLQSLLNLQPRQPAYIPVRVPVSVRRRRQR